MNIYYIKEGSGLYYDNIFNAFQLNNNFNFVKDLSFADALILGPGFLSDEGLKRNENTIIKSGVKKILYLNKEYKNLERKIGFINRNKIEIVLTVHHDFEKWNKLCPHSKFYKIPFAYNEKIFKDYGEQKQFDMGFTGNLFNSKVYKNTGIMGPNFNNIRERIFRLLDTSEKIKKYNRALGEGIYLKGEKYGRAINKTKVWISTPSAIDLVGTRFYEVMGCNTLLFCKMIPGIYEGLFEEGKHFIGFSDDLSDFEDKITYYLENESERMRISKQGFEHVIKNHTWANRVDKVFDILKN